MPASLMQSGTPSKPGSRRRGFKSKCRPWPMQPKRPTRAIVTKSKGRRTNCQNRNRGHARLQEELTGRPRRGGRGQPRNARDSSTSWSLIATARGRKSGPGAISQRSRRAARAARSRLAVTRCRQNRMRAPDFRSQRLGGDAWRISGAETRTGVSAATTRGRENGPGAVPQRSCRARAA